MQFRFRIWSTLTGTPTIYTDSQNEALRAYNCHREYDRIDYKCVGDFHGWRVVSDKALNDVPIAKIYEVDSRFDTLRALIYIVSGIAFAIVGAVAFL
jgi:hypothetical protein